MATTSCFSAGWFSARICLLLCVVGPVVAAAAMPVVTIRVHNAAELSAAVLNAQPGNATVIKLDPAGNYSFATTFLTSTGTHTAIPPITTSIFLAGTNAQSTILNAGSAIPIGRVFTIMPGGSLSITGVTVRGGHMVDEPGGGIANFGGHLTVNNCIVKDNTATRPVEGGANLPSGGGIYSEGGTLDIAYSTILNNRALHDGAGITAINGTTYNIADSLIRGNIPDREPGGHGGGLYLRGTGTITRSTIDHNVGSEAGGGIVTDGTLWLTDSAVVGNSVGVPHQQSYGGGIYNFGALRLKNVTVADNSAGTFGGGIYMSAASVMLMRGSTIVRNTVSSGPTEDVVDHCFPERGACNGGGGIWVADHATVSSARSIIALNTLSQLEPPLSSKGVDCGGPLQTESSNSFGTLSGCEVIPSYLLQGRAPIDLIGDPKLGATVYDDAPGKEYVPLLQLSRLIDAGGPISGVCTVFDQRGLPRVDGNGDGERQCDVGASEFQP